MVEIVLVNYGQAEATLRCLQSLESMHFKDWRVWIVDNASRDDSFEYLARALQQHTKVRLLSSAVNLGFAGGCNLALREILQKTDSQWLWLLNNDTQVDADALGALVRCMEAQADLAMAGSHLMHLDEQRSTQALGGRICWWRGFTQHIYELDQVDQLDYLVGASLLIRRSALEACGLLPEQFFLYFEETDFAMTLKKAGWKLALALDSKVYHEVSLSIASALKLYYTARNQLYFWKKHHPWSLPMVLVFLVTMRIAPQLGRPRALRAILWGIWDFCLGRSGMARHQL